METLWGTFALVSYVPEPLGPALDSIRRSIPGNDRSQAHITLLPPRLLRLPMNEASDQALRILEKFSAFAVEVSSVCGFPGTNVLYLNLTDGNSTIHDLHSELNAGNLEDEELFHFLPHLTLGGPLAEADLPAIMQSAKDAWASVTQCKRFVLQEVVALWAEPVVAGYPQWQRVWTYKLQAAERPQSARASIGRTF